MKLITISNPQEASAPVRVAYCDTFFSKFKGLMFKRELAEDSGALLVENSESKSGTSIHMLFVNFDLTILWLDKNKVVVDKVLAKKWFPFYFPNNPAQYVLELHKSKYSDFKIGDILTFSE